MERICRKKRGAAVLAGLAGGLLHEASSGRRLRVGALVEGLG
jgi:hypothetical protein